VRADPPSRATRVRRKPERGRYERAEIDAVLDEALVCHVGFEAERPFVIPMIHARVADTLYLHGSPGSRLLRRLERGVDVCVTATLVDGLVLARSQFHHSLNYRSAVVLGRARLVSEDEEKRVALRAVVDHVLPGRGDDSREPSPKELLATKVLAVSIDEASAKVRTGPPIDDEDDVALPFWSGVVPLTTMPGAPDPVDPDVPIPDYVRRLVS
jgi:nitroimidazol reductase NimA-like FMN-containing flavoprotein (pyridoxamine 5'-phosphate oxidase superfamily)